jgi:lipid A 4'-phosphatase
MAPSSYRRLWLPDLIVVAALTVATLVLFWVTGLDLVSARVFYHPGHPDGPWPGKERFLWSLLYRSAFWLAGLLVLLGLAALVAGTVRWRSRIMLMYGLLILLSVILGPGLIVNVVAKPCFGRPRPREVTEFGGVERHVPPLMVGEIGKGRSFPCGHCSVGYIYCVFRFIWRRRRPRLAAVVLCLSILLGTLLGLARLAAGGHFPSDIIIAGCVCFSVPLVLYHSVLQIPQREDAAAPSTSSVLPS